MKNVLYLQQKYGYNKDFYRALKRFNSVQFLFDIRLFIGQSDFLKGDSLKTIYGRLKFVT